MRLSLWVLLGSILQLIFTSEGSLLPLFDHPPYPSIIESLLADPWSDRFPDPFRVLEQLPLAVERDDSLALSPARVDWKETSEGHVITLDVPGLKKDDLKIEVEENRVLHVSGERKREDEKKGDHWHRVERSCGKFWRRFRLPENAYLDTINAKLENGVLTISFAKLSPDRIKGPKVVAVAEEESKMISQAKEEL